jgi:hypothetical protein
MLQLREWLARQGLETLAAVLIENDVDLDILPDLTDQDLERLFQSLPTRANDGAVGAAPVDRVWSDKRRPWVRRRRWVLVAQPPLWRGSI